MGLSQGFPGKTRRGGGDGGRGGWYVTVYFVTFFLQEDMILDFYDKETELPYKGLTPEKIKECTVSRDVVYMRRDLLQSADLHKYAAKQYNFEDQLRVEFQKYDITY